MMDANRDGFIDEADLKAIHNDLGRNPSDKELKEMLTTERFAERSKSWH